MGRDSRRAPALILAGTLLVSCLPATYIPRRSPRIVVVPDGYRVDGRTIPRGAFGGGIVEATRDNPRANAEARVAYERQSDFLVVLGVACALVVASAQIDDDNQLLQQGVMWTSLAALFGALGLMYDGVDRTANAINIYNDSAAGAP